jgi:hypothetical protein
MDAELQNKIYKYLDKNGIPIRRIATISATYKPNIYNEGYLTDTLQHNLNSPQFSLVPELPFEITESEMIEVVKDYILDTTGVRINHIGQLSSNPSFNGNPFLLLLNEHSERQKISLAKKAIPGSLILRYNYGNYGFESLGNIEVIRGDFGVSDSQIKSLGNLRKIYKDLWIKSYEHPLHLTSLYPLSEVGGNVSIRNVSFKSLESLEKVKGNLSISGTEISDLGNLKFVGGNFIAPRHLYENYDFSGLEIKGKVRLINNS